MALNKKYAIIALVIVAILSVLFYFMTRKSNYDTGGSGADGRSVTDKGNLIVYGSKTCPWCQKQEKYLMTTGIPYTFVDCNTEACPEFVSGYPTLLLNNQVLNGYTEV